MAEQFTIIDAMTDPALFGDQFGGDSFAGWRALLAAFYGLPMDDEAQETVKAITGREDASQDTMRELWLVVGRRGGKSNVSSLIATYEAAFLDHRDRLAPGEWATVPLIAADRAQARTLMRYVRGYFENPMLRRMIVRESETSIELSNRCAIEVATASFRAVRGYTLAAVVCDEIAFWMAEGATPDVEIIAALRPALATLDGRLIALSSPYARRGELWNTYKRHFGGASQRVLVAQAPSLVMNPTLPAHVIEDAMREDPARAKAEYLAEFRSDIASLIAPELVEDATRPKPLELPHARGLRYIAFVDPAGGGPDEFTLSIGHREGDAAVIDLVRGLRGSPAEIVAEFAEVVRRYGLRKVTGDRYAGRWPRDEFQKHGIQYEVSDMDRTALYLELLAAMNSGRVEFPPCPMVARQLTALERRTGPSGRDRVDHPPGANDDRANALAGVVANIMKPPAFSRVSELKLHA